MQNSFLTTIKSLKIVDGCKAIQVYALNPYGCEKSSPEQPLGAPPRPPLCNNPVVSDSFLPYGLPSLDGIEPPIESHLKAVDFVETLAGIHRLLRDAPPAERFGIHLYQYSVFRDLADPKLLRRSLRAARQHAVSAHDKLVTAAWLRFERREDELEGALASKCAGRILECPVAALLPGYDPESVYDPCPCRRPPADACNDGNLDNDGSDETKVEEDVQIDDDDNVVVEEDAQIDEDDCVVVVEDAQMEECSTSADEGDVAFCIGDEEVVCTRSSIAALSKPLRAMLYGCFREAWKEKINFSQNGISVNGMRAVNGFSRTGCLDSFPIETILELLSFANIFCCEKLKSACDQCLASSVDCIDDAVSLIEFGLEETAHLLVGACLQVFLRELPKSFNLPEVSKLLCSEEGRERLDMVGHASFVLYYFLSQVAMEEDLQSNRTVMLLERLEECANHGWQKQLAAHQLGCVLLEREEYKDAQHWFEASTNAGHVYSMAGVARAKYKRGHKYSAYKLANSLISEHKTSGWMLQERSLYCVGKEKMADLNDATKVDPTLTFPYKYRAVVMAEENKKGAAISEMNKILGFKVTADCLELRAWFSLATEEYEAALRDIRALLTLDPDYMIFHGNLRAEQLMEMLCQKLQPWGAVDCWMQLHDRWSCVDDIGSLAVVHQMLQLKDTAMTPSTLRFRQSLLLLRLNCQKAAMRSLRLARNLSADDCERLVYEGWILYDTGHREEALAKAEESIKLKRSFEAFFLKAYALADTNLDSTASSLVIELLEDALNCQSDGLRKGQAWNNLGSVHVDCNDLLKAEDCYKNALEIRHTRAHQGLARVHLLKNQRKAAYDEMTKLIEKARNNASAYEKRSEYCDRDMAKSDLSMATQLDPLRTYPYRYRAAVLMDDHKEEEAIAELTKAIEFRADLQLLHLRAAFYESMGNAAAALRDCEAALCLDPNHPDTLDLYNKSSAQVGE